MGEHVKRLATILCVPAVAWSAGFPLVDGDRQATIVFSRAAAKPPAKAWQYEVGPEDPYRELRKYIAKTTRRGLEVISEDDPKLASAAFPIYVGDCRAAREVLGTTLGKLDRDGYVIVVEPRRAFIVGPRPLATYWGVCHFLREHLGVRWLLPGPLGEDVVRRRRVVLAPTRRVEEPVFLARQWSGMGYAKGGVQWCLRHRTHMASFYARHTFSHNTQNIFDPDKYYDKHPNFFPMRGGKRFRPKHGAHNWQPCMTEPGAVRLAADTAREYWQEHPSRETYSFGTSDGAGWCHCPGCVKLRDPKHEFGGYPSPYSDLYYSWLTKIATDLEKTHPGKLLGCLAYTNSVAPPKGVTMHRNIMPYITFSIADTHSPRRRAAAERIIEEWGAMVGQIGQYDYAYGERYVMPRIYQHLIQKTLQHGLKHNVKGVYAEQYVNWGLDAPRVYLTAALWWDPDADIDALFDEWNERMFRAAAGPMKKHFARCERALYDSKAHLKWPREFSVFAKDALFDAYPPAVVKECTAYLDEAAQLAQSDPVKQRIHFFRKTWDLGVLFAGAYWGSDEVRQFVEQGAPLPKIADAMRDMGPPMTKADFEREFKLRVGRDRLAHFPITRRGLLGGKSIPGTIHTEVLLITQRLVPEVIAEFEHRGNLDGAAIRSEIDRRITAAFTPRGSAGYQVSVKHLRQLALKVARVPKTLKLPAIDGVLDDAAWSGSQGQTEFTVRGTMDAATYATTVRLAHDGRDLFVALTCFQDTATLAARATKRDDTVWKDDCVEVFVRSADRPNTWAQFAVNAAGGLFDRWRDDTGVRASHNFGCQWAAKVLPDRWTAELRVPLAEMQVSPERHPILRMNVVRNVAGKPGEISSWFPEPKSGAHAALSNQMWAILGEPK